MYSAPPRLNLVVIRSPDIDRAAAFYRSLGLLFTKHSHGSGPEHYSSEVGGLVFEIYPLADGQPPTTAVRVGFVVDDIDSVVRLVTEAGAAVVSAPRDSPWGRRAVVRDLDGHSVELVS
jgi:lactoylglutathione lyase